MATQQVALNRLQRADVEALGQLPLNQYEQIKEAISKIGQRSIVATDVLPILNEYFPEERSSSILKTLVALATTSRYSGQSLADTVDNIRTSDPQSDTSEQLFEIGAERAQQLLSLPFILSSAKAVDLSYDYQNLYRSSRVLVDIRPIFDDTRSDLVGGIVSFVMRLDYSNGPMGHTLSVAMDMPDILQLKAACEIALQKARASQGFLEKKGHLMSFIVGDETHGDE